MKAKLILLFTAFLIAVNAGAVPACPEPFEVTQPDGTILTLHMIGDEYYHWVETSENQVVVQSEEGYYEYATILNNEIVPSGIKAVNRLGASGLATRSSLPNREQLVGLMMNKRTAIIAEMDSIRRAEELLEPSMNTRASNISLTKGNQKVLCILIGFPDRPFCKSKTEFENMWNKTNYNICGSRGSIKDFYNENSYGQMNVTATVVGPYMAKKNSSHYATNGSGSATNSNVRQLVREALQAAKEEVEFADFDVNDDKIVDAVHIVFAGYAQDYNPTVGLIWSHHWHLSTAVWQGLYKAKEYFITSELALASGNYIAPIGTVCHEYAHQLGAPDFYINSDYSGTGKWDVMGSGNWNGSSDYNYFRGRCPAHHNPYTKAYIFDWVTPTIISPSVMNTIYTLTPVHNTPSIYRINTSTNNEFYLLENKKAQSLTFNQYVPDSGGLLIYHIHNNIENSIDNNNVNTLELQKCHIVRANATSATTCTPVQHNEMGIECAYPYDNKIFFTSTSTPSSKSLAGIATGVDLSFIQRVGNNIQFVVNQQIIGDETLSGQSTYSTALPANSTIKWTYTFTPANPLSPWHRILEPIIFANGDSVASVVVKRGKYPTINGDTIVDGPMHPGIKSNTSSADSAYFTGEAVLKATITSGGYSYSISKTITLSTSNTIAMCNIEEETSILQDECVSQFNSKDIASYTISHTNPISSNNAIIYINKLQEVNDYYLPCGDNYTLEIWHDQLGLVKRIKDSVSDLYLDCSDMPTGVYQMILIVNEQIVAQSKLLKI